MSDTYFAPCWLLAGLLACAVGAGGRLYAQAPHVGYAYPAGGRQGTTFRVVVGGQFLRDAHDAYVSGEGVGASVVETIRPFTDQELGEVDRFLHDLVRRRWSARVMEAAAKQQGDRPPIPDHPWLRDLGGKSAAELARLRATLFNPKKQPNAQIAEQVEIEVTIDPKAAPGDRELRLATPAGLTNPLRFQVGVLPEVREEDLGGPGEAHDGVVDLPALLNGQILPGEVDRFRLRARKGQQLVIRAQARSLIPYLADAVPGWFQATVALYDPQGNEVAYDDDYRFDPDPVLFYPVPEDGVYGLEVRDALYRGRDDFVYRIAVGELPFITQMFPLGGQAGTPTVAAITGWNLPAQTLSLDTRPGGDHVRQATVGQDLGLCNEMPYAVDVLPECTETEPNDTTAGAQKVALPTIVNGRIGQPGDVDIFQFDGRAGDEVVAEVYARRLNSPLDSALKLLGGSRAAPTVVAANDDHEDPERGLITHQADSYLRVRLPQDGVYLVCLSDMQHQGGDAYGYRLRVGPAQPDFAARVTPASVNLSPGGSATVTIHAVRKDGFDGEVSVALKDAPAGFVLNGGKIASGKDSAEMTLTAPRSAPPQAFPVQLEASAQIGGAPVSRPVVPAEDMMQAFAYRHLVPQQELLVEVTGSRPVPAVWRPLVPGIELASATPVRVPLGGTVQVQLKAPPTLPDRRQSELRAVRFTLAGRPRGVTLQGSTLGATGVTLTLQADENLAEVGEAAYVIVEASTELASQTPGGQLAIRTQHVSLGVLPAIPIQIVQP